LIDFPIARCSALVPLARPDVGYWPQAAVPAYPLFRRCSGRSGLLADIVETALLTQLGYRRGGAAPPSNYGRATPSRLAAV
jgi:hypothetical protein